MRLVIDAIGFVVVVFLVIGFARGLIRNSRSGRTDSGPDWAPGDDGPGHSGDSGGFGPGT